MIIAWTLMGALTVASVFYVMHYLLRKEDYLHEDTQAQFLTVRSQEVKEEQSIGRLTADEAAQLLEDVGNEARYAEQHATVSFAKDARLARIVLSAMIAAVMVGSVALYQKLGFAPEVSFTQKMIDQSATEQEVADFLAYRVQRYDRAEDWYYLANDQVMTQQFDQAIDSFREVLARVEQGSEDAVNVQVELAQTLFYANNNTVSQPMIEAVSAALKQHPQNSKALGLQGIIEYDSGRYKDAILVWQNAILNGSDRNERMDLLAGIAAARKQGGITEQMVPPIVTHTLHLQLDLDARKLSSADVFLVYAQRPGQAMPVAIQRVPVTQIQAPIVLTNLDSLMPGETLADVTTVDIVVKRSSSSASDLTLGEVVGHLRSIPSNSDKIFKVNVGL